jgi:hypothetical protein
MGASSEEIASESTNIRQERFMSLFYPTTLSDGQRPNLSLEAQTGHL